MQELGGVGSWTLVAAFDDAGTMTAVFEELGKTRGRLAFVGRDGLRLELRKSLEPTESGDDENWYRGHRKQDVLPGRPDVLRTELLAAGDDPQPADVLSCFPPVRRAFWEGQERPHTFIGTPESTDVIPLYYADVPMVSRVPVTVVAPGSGDAIQAENLWEGLVGGWLPVTRVVYPKAPNECWEVTSFAPPEGGTEFLQPAWYRYVRLRDGKPQEVRYLDSYIPYPHAASPKASDFYRGLLATYEYWQRRLAPAMRLRVPEGWVEDHARHALVLENITRRGDHPKYGVADQAYGGAEHDGFQDTLVSSVLGCLEWGLFAMARRYLDYYLRVFLRPNGSIRYRGPEIGKYGVTLTCLAQYYDYTDDDSLLADHDGKIKAIVAMLVRRWEDARRRDPGDAAYGMISGWHEADIGFLTPTLHELDYDRPYLSNTGEAWRGVRDIALCWERMGANRDDSELAARGATLIETASAIFADARAGVERSWIEKDGVVGLPIIAGSSSFYWEAPYRSCPESYDENRVWSELLYSGVLSREPVKKIWDIAGERGGTTLGVFNNRLHMVGFLVWEAVHGLLQHDLVPEALLIFYAHAFHAHTRGTLTAIECVDMDRDRAAHTPYCIPAQMTIPLIAKWLLVFEDPVSRTITLGQGTPRAWLAHGQEFGAQNAPTRRGHVTFLVRSRVDEGHIDAEITLPPRSGAPVRLRLRCPRPYALSGVEVLGRSDLDASLEGDTITLSEAASGTVTLRASCAATSDSASPAAAPR